MIIYMKKILIICWFLSFVIATKAQEVLMDKKDDIKHKKGFFRKHQARLLKKINEAKVILDIENKRIKQLVALDNTLKLNGNISDSIYTMHNAKLASYQFENDSLNKKSVDFENKVSSIKVVRYSFFKVKKAVNKYGDLIQANEVKYKTDLDSIELDLKKSDLGGEKKQLTAILGKADEQLKKDVVVLDNLGEVKNKRKLSSKYDSLASSGADARILKYLKKIEENSAEIKDLQNKIGSSEYYAANSASIKSRVFVIDSVVNKSAAAKQYSFEMIEEGINYDSKTLFSLAAFFGPGGFSIPEEKLEKATLYFSPVIDSLIKFSNKYASKLRTATIIVNGYSDASNITKGSILYQKLAANLKIDNPTKEQLNKSLSTLRAEELSKLFIKIINQKSTSFISLPKITFENVEIGRGEKLPDQSIKNYKVNDERRRIVIVFWTVLPDE
jgi:hypothetical protein